MMKRLCKEVSFIERKEFKPLSSKNGPLVFASNKVYQLCMELKHKREILHKFTIKSFTNMKKILG